MNGSTRDRLIDTLQDLAIRISVGGGFVLGLFAGLQGHPPAADCPRGESCVGEQLAAALWSVFGPALAGAAAGLGLSLVIVLVLRRLRVPRSVRDVSRS